MAEKSPRIDDIVQYIRLIIYFMILGVGGPVLEAVHGTTRYLWPEQSSKSSVRGPAVVSVKSLTS